MEILLEIIGWIGTSLVVLAYFLVSTNKIKASSKRYRALNFFGAVGVGINVFYHHSWSSFVLQVIWMIIAILSLLKNKKGNS